MNRTTFVAAGAIALAMLAGNGAAALAQSVTPDDMRAGTAVPHRVSGGKTYRPLTVKRHRSDAPVAFLPVPPPPPFAGPAAIVRAPVHVASAIVGLPFHILGGIFPATGNIAVAPLVLIGAPIQAAGQIAQFPFHVVDAAFGAPYPIEPAIIQ